MLDEPTATLHGEEVNVLKGAVRTLAAHGTGVIYITHRLGEAVELADRALVLRNGVRILEEARGAFDHDGLVRAIAGDDVQTRARRATPSPRAPFLEARNLASPSLRGVTFHARQGEILGVSGLVGSGMERVNGAVFGAFPPAGGTVFVDGKALALGSPRSAMRAGVAYVPADRRARASIGHFSARENLTLAQMRDLRHPWGGVNRARERHEAFAWMTKLRVVPRGQIEQAFDLFSGGNQQKIVLAKWLRTRPRVILVDEPTQGVDAGAQAEIHELLVKAAEDGAAVVVASSDTKELAQICDRALVMQDESLAQNYRAGHQRARSHLRHYRRVCRDPEGRPRQSFAARAMSMALNVLRTLEFPERQRDLGDGADRSGLLVHYTGHFPLRPNLDLAPGHPSDRCDHSCRADPSAFGRGV